jgi:pilus assembly protein CpaE
MSSSNQVSAAHRNTRLSIAIISPDWQRRIAASSALAQCGNVQTLEFTESVLTADELRQLYEGGVDAVLIDLDSHPEDSLNLVEQLCMGSSLIVMVFSAQADPDLMLRSLRAGAREFFILPFKPETIAKALQWVSAQLQPAPQPRKAAGRLQVFFGSKGGVGVTTLACNFAVAVAEVPGQRTLLIDLNLLMGDAAVLLGVQPKYTIVDALQKIDRLDEHSLSAFFTPHSSGLSVLAAPAEVSPVKAPAEAIGKLLALVRRQFDNVIVDAGKKIELRDLHLFDESATAYLVTQVGIPELRNANRLISQFSTEFSPKLEIVVNRHQSRFMGFTDEHLSKALTRPVAWKVPNDYKAVRQMQSTGIPIVHQESPVANVMRLMARGVTGTSDSPEDKLRHGKSAGLFRIPWKGAAKPLDEDASPEEAHRAAHAAARSLSGAMPR